MKLTCLLGTFFINPSLCAMQPANNLIVKKLQSAIAHDHTQSVDLLLGSHTFSRYQKATALAVAVRENYKNSVALLLQHATPVNKYDSGMQTPLLTAVLLRNTALVEWLRIYGADPCLSSPLYDLENIPTILECEAGDSDLPFISPLNLARARMNSPRATAVDQRIYAILCKPAESYADPALKEKVAVTTNSCLDAIRHSNTPALKEYLEQCTIQNRKRKQKYLDDRFKEATLMGNTEASDMLFKAGARPEDIFEECALVFKVEALQIFMKNQYVSDDQIENALKKVKKKEYDPLLIPSPHQF